MAVEGTAASKRPESRVAGAVARAVLIGAVVSIAGCIIPTPLSQQQAPVNSPPTILTNEVTPAPFTGFTETQSSFFTFHIAASDVDLGDTLTARLLFASSSTAPKHFQDDTTLVASPGGDGTVRTGFIPSPTGKPYCSQITGLVFAYVAVSDDSFSSADGDDTPDNDSNRAEISWPLTCTD